MIANKRLQIIGGIAAIFSAFLLAAAIIPVFQDNFLVLIIKLHTGVNGVQEGSLEGINFLDFSILVLVGTMFLTLYPILKSVYKIWATIAVALPFIGLVLYLLTEDIGRSGILAAGLIIAVMMLRSPSFSKGTAFLGILANGCLLIGDIGIAYSYGKILAIFMAVGYVLVLIWYSLIGWKLFQLRNG